MNLFGLKTTKKKTMTTSKPRIFKGTDADAYKKAS